MEITHAFLFKTILKQTHIYFYGTLFISYLITLDCSATGSFDLFDCLLSEVLHPEMWLLRYRCWNYLSCSLNCIFVFTCVEHISQLQTDTVVKQCENPQISFRSVFAECLGDARDSRTKSKTSCIAHMSGSMARSLLWSCRVTILIVRSKIDWKKLQFNNQSEVQYQWLPCRFTRKKNWSKLNR